MAEYGEWNQKGATLSDVTAEKEYGVGRDFIVKVIRAGKLEYREGSVWGNPYLRLLRRQLEQYIADEIGDDRLYSGKNKTELRKVKAQIRKNLARGGREITRTRELRRRVTFADLLAMVETLRTFAGSDLIIKEKLRDVTRSWYCRPHGKEITG